MTLALSPTYTCVVLFNHSLHTFYLLHLLFLFCTTLSYQTKLTPKPRNIIRNHVMSSENHFLLVPLSTVSTMPTLSLLTFLILCLVILSLFLSPGGLAWSLSKANLTIPGPTGLPFLGLVLPFTGSANTHRILSKLAKNIPGSTHLMAFSIGLTRCIISSEPGSAREILNSPCFANRPIKESAYELLFNRAIGFAPYGEYWRNLRRISSTHLFHLKRIEKFGDFRQEVGLKMVHDINTLMEKNDGVRVKRILHYGSLNNVMMSVFGKSYNFDENSDGNEGFEIEKMVNEGYELIGMFNWSDHFPLLDLLDLQGMRKRCRRLKGKVNVFVSKIIEEHKLMKNSDHENDNNGRPGDFVDVLLDLNEENSLSDSDMIAVLWEMVFRGTDTVAILLEWILARMVLHPELQAKAQSEIDNFIGHPYRSVSDSDLPNLPYIKAIVKETLRMHPPGPLLSWARLAIEDTQVGHHFIPAGTTAMVNMWAITHDDQVWPESNVFNPERFMNEETDVAIMGSDLRLAPFGSGRRVCPGKAMGLATVHLWLAQLLQNFKWVSSEDGVDLSECLKLSLEMKHPLFCKALSRVA